jgi:hypothetical protein
LGKIVDRDLEGAEMTLRASNLAAHNRKLRIARRRDHARRLEQHGHIERALEQVGRFHGVLITAVDENDAFALEVNRRHIRQCLGRRGQQRRHFGTGAPAFARPARHFAYIRVGDGCLAPGLLRQLIEQGGFLRAGDGQGAVIAQGGLKTVDLGPAQMASGGNLAAAATLGDGVLIEDHRVLARADDDVPGRIGHQRSFPSVLSGPAYVGKIAVSLVQDYNAP